jgi:predicted esterase
MCRAIPGLILILAASLTISGCMRGPAVPGTATNDPAGKPTPPLAIPTPPPPPSVNDGKDLRTIPNEQLEELARKFEKAQDYPHAAIVQYWVVERTKAGQYDLACFLARTGKADPAFYWLQVAALEEGVDTDYAERDEDLAALRADPRWPDVRTYLAACNRFYESSGIKSTALILPKGYKKGTPIAAVVWLHGLGSSPEDFVNDTCQHHADRLNAAIVGVSGTVPRGPKKFVWAVDAERDAKRVRDAIAEVSDRLTIKPGHLIALGFSQGAQVGVEIAVRNPEEYAGAIALSPGADVHLKDVKPPPLLARRGFVITWGEDEAPGNVQLAKYDARWLSDVKAQVQSKEYAGVREHAFPRDFNARFFEWVKFIEQTRGE